MFKSEFESERVFRENKNSILTSFFCNFWKIQKRTNSEYSVNLECSETPVFDPKTHVFDPNLFLNFSPKIFTNSEKPGISEKFPNFGNQTIPKLGKMKNAEISVFCRALSSFYQT